MHRSLIIMRVYSRHAIIWSNRFSWIFATRLFHIKPSISWQIRSIKLTNTTLTASTVLTHLSYSELRHRVIVPLLVHIRISMNFVMMHHHMFHSWSWLHFMQRSAYWWITSMTPIIMHKMIMFVKLRLILLIIRDFFNLPLMKHWPRGFVIPNVIKVLRYLNVLFFECFDPLFQYSIVSSKFNQFLIDLIYCAWSTPSSTMVLVSAFFHAVYYLRTYQILIFLLICSNDIF